jgi:hypothetical protein
VPAGPADQPRPISQEAISHHRRERRLGHLYDWWRVRGVNAAGTAGAWSSVRSFTPQGAPAAAALSAVSVHPSSVVGGNTSQGTVTLTAAAPSGGVVVTLSDNSSAATPPASVTVAPGATSASFAIPTRR